MERRSAPVTILWDPVSIQFVSHMFFARLIPYILTTALIACFSVAIISPLSLLPCAISAAILIGLATFVVTGRRLWSKDFWLLLTTPFWLSASSLSLLVMVESPMARWFIALGVPLFIGFFLNQIVLFHFLPERYQAYTLENLSLAANLLVVFLASASLYGVQLYLGLGWIMLISLCLAMTVTVSLQSVWVHKFDRSRAWIWCLVLVLGITELFIALSLFPTSYTVNGVVIAIAYGTIMNIIRLANRSNLERRAVFSTLGLSASLIILTLATARWV